MMRIFAVLAFGVTSQLAGASRTRGGAEALAPVSGKLLQRSVRATDLDSASVEAYSWSAVVGGGSLSLGTKAAELPADSFSNEAVDPKTVDLPANPPDLGGELRGGLTSGPGFFVEDVQKMAEMPSYKNVVHKDDKSCSPMCNWRCGPQKECEQVCEPVCMPPQCQILCSRKADACETRCGAPRCAVVCPQCSNGETGNCPKCRTVCSPPVCTTQCGDDCESQCTEPQCSWKCKAGTCPEPKCEMTCLGVSKCGADLHSANSSKIPAFPGRKIVASGDASLDPKILSGDVWPAPPAWTTTFAPFDAQALAHPTAAPVGEVRALKLRWAARDDRQETIARETRFQRSLDGNRVAHENPGKDDTAATSAGAR